MREVWTQQSTENGIAFFYKCFIYKCICIYKAMTQLLGGITTVAIKSQRNDKILLHVVT